MRRKIIVYFVSNKVFAKAKTEIKIHIIMNYQNIFLLPKKLELILSHRNAI